MKNVLISLFGYSLVKTSEYEEVCNKAVDSIYNLERLSEATKTIALRDKEILGMKGELFFLKGLFDKGLWGRDKRGHFKKVIL